MGARRLLRRRRATGLHPPRRPCGAHGRTRMKTRTRAAQSVEFRDSSLAHHDMETISQGLSAAIVGQIRSLLSASPDPDRVVHALASLRNQKPDDFNRIVELALWLCRNSPLSSHGAAFSPKRCCSIRNGWKRWKTRSACSPKEEYVEELEAALTAVQPDTPDALTLAQFRRRQILRILMRDVLGWARCPRSPRSFPISRTPFSTSATGESASATGRAARRSALCRREWRSARVRHVA